MAQVDIHWKPPGPVARQFMLSEAFFRGIRGPVGSGKSVTCCMDLMRYASQVQAPATHGQHKSKRLTKTIVVRNTYPELKTTTIETWLQWFPERYFGRFVWTPPFTHYIRFADVRWDVIFLALDREEDVRKLLSLEATNAWINEARQVPKSIVDAITMRVGRHPMMSEGGPTRSYIIADTNPPKKEHWWPIIAGEAKVPKYYTEEQARMMVKPPDWEFFNQPPAMIEIKGDDGMCVGWEPNEESENRDNLVPGYYDRIVQGKTPQWVRVYCGNQLGDDVAGKPVHPEYSEDFHCREFEVHKTRQFVIGLDFGLSPAAAFCQYDDNQPFDIFDEICFVDMSIEQFAEQVHNRIVKWEQYLDTMIEWALWGDPSGDSRSSFDPKGRTTFRILADCGVHARAARTNDPLVRVETVAGLLAKQKGGTPRLRVHPRCEKINEAFKSGYRYKRKTQAIEEQYEDRPDKNEFSHPMDAVQYAALGAGLGPLKRHRNLEPVIGRVPYDVYNRPSAIDMSRGYRGRPRP